MNSIYSIKYILVKNILKSTYIICESGYFLIDFVFIKNVKNQNLAKLKPRQFTPLVETLKKKIKIPGKMQIARM